MDDNLRRAYLQEELGVYLLKGIAAVASVERPQDVGIDAIATLLRRDSQRRLFAENSFYVQLKSASVQSVKYEGSAISWLMELRLPLFIGRIDPSKCSISLYTSHRGMAAASHWQYKSLEFVLGETTSTDPLGWKEEAHAQGSRTEFDARIFLGQPVLTWNAEDVTDPAFIGRCFAVMKPLLEIEARNIRWRNVGYHEGIKWETGSAVQLSEISMSPPNPDVYYSLDPIRTERDVLDQIYARMLPQVSSELRPAVLAWAMLAMNNARFENWSLIEQMLNFLDCNAPNRSLLRLMAERGNKKKSQFDETNVKDARSESPKV
jgi:hypothetical protein